MNRPEIKPRGEISKLSKWAQEYVHSLLMRIDSLEKSLDALSNEHPNSNVVLAARQLQDPDTGLPPDSTIYFYGPGEPDRLTNMIVVHHDRDNPNRLHVASYGSRGLILRMSSSNAMYLELERRLWA